MRLSDEEAGRRLGEARVLRLATVGPDGAPHQVPATFAWYAGPRGPRIAIAVDHKPKRHQNLRRLRNIAARPQVCVLADEYSDDWARLWWVRADGTARVLAGGGTGSGPGDGRGGGDAGTGGGAAGPGTEDAGEARGTEDAGEARGTEGPGGGVETGDAGRGARIEDDGGDAAERARALDLLAAKYPQYTARRPEGPVIVIEVERLTGWAYTDPLT